MWYFNSLLSTIHLRLFLFGHCSLLITYTPPSFSLSDEGPLVSSTVIREALRASVDQVSPDVQEPLDVGRQAGALWGGWLCASVSGGKCELFSEWLC